MRFSATVSLAVALASPLAAGPPAAPPAPRRVARYDLAESRKSVSPAGERASAVAGHVVVLGGTARWDLVGGTFPRTKADAVVLGERGGWLVDRKGPTAARAGLDELGALFVPPAAGDPGPFQSRVDDVVVPPAELSKGPAFEGRPSTRLRLTASWSLVTSMPGRVGRARCRLTALVDAVEEGAAEARSPLDDLGRLLGVPEKVREAIAPELARVRGLPVGVVVETEAELAVDGPGMAPPAAEGRSPLRTRTEATRTVSSLVTGPEGEGDAALFPLTEETRVVGIERLVEPLETLR
ncbi:MAG: hypothetical protein U0529_11455 [Thermoanaerobaculia bacterium]